MSNVYKVLSEYSAPTFYDYETNEVLYDECDASEQALWVVSYDPDNKEVLEWLERYYIDEIEDARARAKELNEEGE